MKFCSHCGNEVLDEAIVCPKCGCRVDYANAAMSYRQVPSPDDAPNAGYAVLGFFIPLVGLILYLIWEKDYPQRAKSAGKGALIFVLFFAGCFFLGFLLALVNAI